MSIQSTRGRIWPISGRLFVGLFAVFAVLLCGPQGHAAAEVQGHGHADAAVEPHSAAAEAAAAASPGRDDPASHEHGIISTADAADDSGCGGPMAVGEQYAPAGPAAVTVPALSVAPPHPAAPPAQGDQRQLSGRSLLTERCVSRT